jgi:hypothetical protein
MSTRADTVGQAPRTPATERILVEFTRDELDAIDKRIRRHDFPVSHVTRSGTVKALVIIALTDRGEL